MSDLIDRQALLKQIDIDSDGEPGYYGDTWKFIDTIKSMPPTELSTNLAEVDTDLISRAKAIDGKICIRRSNGVEIYDDYVVPVEYLEQLPPAQPNVHDLAKDADCISRRAAITALSNEIVKRRLLDEMYDGCIDEFQTEEILKKLPSAQPEIVTCDRCVATKRSECIWHNAGATYCSFGKVTE